MRKIEMTAIQNGSRISYKVILDENLFEDTDNFMKKEYTDGAMADLFHFITSSRYKKPTEALPKDIELLRENMI